MSGKKPDRIGTVFDRTFSPQSQNTLYHYCSTPIFLSILESGKLRFSDINMMNDPAEWAYAYELFERAANSALDDAKENPSLEGLDTDFFI